MHSVSQVRSRMVERQAGRRDDGSPERPPYPANLATASKARRFHAGIMILPLRPPTDWRRRLCGIRKRKRQCRQGYPLPVYLYLNKHIIYFYAAFSKQFLQINLKTISIIVVLFHNNQFSFRSCDSNIMIT